MPRRPAYVYNGSTWDEIGDPSKLPLTGGTVTGETVVSSSGSGTTLEVRNTGTGKSFVVEDSANPDSTPFVVNADGRVLIGHDSAQTVSVNAGLQISGPTGMSFISLTRFSNDEFTPGLILAKSRGTSFASRAAVQSGDNLGSIIFRGDDGTNWVDAGRIFAAVDGTPGTNDMPSRLVFNTTADGASTSTERMRIDSAGNVGIGTTSPAQTLHVAGTGLIAANSSSNALEIRQTGAGNALVVEDATNPDATPFVIDTVGRVLRGTTTPIVGSITPDMQSTGANSANAGFGLYGFNAANSGPQIEMGLSANASVGSHTVVNSGDALGTIRFSGSDGTNFIRGAQIVAAVDGTPGTNDMPGRLIFSTTADGASTPTERMRIDNAGVIWIGNGSDSASPPNVNIRATRGSGTDVAGGSITILGGNSTGTASGGVITFNTCSAGSVSSSALNSSTERMRITAAGNVGIGTSSPDYSLTVASTVATTLAADRYQAGTGQPGMFFRKSRNATVGSQTIVQSGDGLGGIFFAGSDGSAFSTGAGITAVVSGTPGASDVPAYLSFNTKATGVAYSEKMRLDGAGLITGTGTSLGAWTAYTPTLGGTGWALGNGTVSGAYCQIGKIVHYRASITFGSTSTFGAGGLTITLPVTGISGATGSYAHRARFNDTSAGASYFGDAAPTSTTVLGIGAIDSAIGIVTSVISTKPFTWASTDIIYINGTYEAA